MKNINWKRIRFLLKCWITRRPVPNGRCTVISGKDYHDTWQSKIPSERGDELQVNYGGPATSANGKKVTHVFKCWNGKRWIDR